MFLIVVYNEKGGVGKSSISHALCYGAGLVEDKDFKVVMGHTDKREPAFDESRSYAQYDMRDPQEGFDLLQAGIESEDKGLFSIDTGANLADYSSLILEAADLILVAVVDDFDSVRMAKAAGNIHPEKTAFIVNRSPAKHASEFHDFEKEVLVELGDKPVLFFPQMRAIKHLLRPEPLTPRVRTRLRPHVVKLWKEVKEILT